MPCTKVAHNFGADMLYIVVGFILVIASTAWFHIQQNNKLSKYWQQQLDKSSAEWMNRFAWTRTAQLLGAMGAALAVVLFVHNHQLAETNAILSSIQQSLEPRLSELATTQKQTSDALLQFKAAYEENLKNTAQPKRVAQVDVSAQAVELKANDELAARIEKQAQPVTLKDIYDPEENATDNQSAMDAIKKRYEGLLVNYLFLKKCGLINAQDYHTIISALAQEMASVNAPGRLEHDIQTAANGSYQEMYAQSSCSGAEIKALNKQYNDYIKTISVNIPHPTQGK